MREKTAPTLEAIQHAPMHEIVYDRLRDALSSGEILPGQRLVIRDLADMLGTSVMPIREALRRLEAENAVVAIGGRTLSVPILTASEYEEIGMIRAELEGLAAFEAASVITTQEINQIEEYANLSNQAACDLDGEAAALYNRLFHQGINNASRKPLLLKMIDSLWLRLGPQMAYTFKKAMVAQKWEAESYGVFHPHKQAIDALRTGNPTAAKAAIMYDISCVCRSIVSYMKSREAKEAMKTSPKPVRGKKKNGIEIPQLSLPKEIIQ
ncbi:MAG: GntR family transcriptional regulator [Methyloligellaceae bacterium]